ncbi:hypothetical protein ACVXHM_17585 [Pseudomonas aeruginosa]|uniref:Uncharacterized protein n=2 Tax=Pseudomonadaceae TaxID=135621 RepID=A0A379PK62_ECTOL|nr:MULTISPECIES: hypothetical protein [Pseudomonas]OWK42882.1 hypothetical protein PSOLE_28950 [Pseudomonas oleovorans subsp. oleovorans]ELQ8317821.1 hypothetical protein [Pseudomonas aeruginosa]MBI6904494.1 hypothetical protein [Pseudomonas aeruginosa]MCR7872848.1 hypothetical protein [Pseudomonas aeruginosa]MCV4064220.1 hypothetical protein [Pseudomonas aeruginosa]
MKKPSVSVLSGMSSGMIAAILGTLVLCVFGTLKLEARRELPSDYDRLDRNIQEAQALISDYVAAPVLPPLEESWREVAAALELNGLELKPDDGSMANGSVSTYEGPLKHWGGMVDGDAKTILAVIKKVQQTEPVYLLDYSMDDGEFKLYLAVVGI